MSSRGYLSSLRALFSGRRLGELSRIRTKRNRIRRQGGTERLEDRTLLTAPYSFNDSYSVASGGVLTVPANGVLANDIDMDGNALTAHLYMPAMMGTVTLNSNGSFVYTAPSAFTGSVPFYYRAFDGTEFGNMATVNITVTTGGGGSGGGGGSTNQPPVPGPDSFFVEQNSSGAKLPVLWNDTDPNSNPLSITSVTTPAHGTASPQFDYYTNKTIVSYSPIYGYSGADSFNYTLSDGSLTASTTDTLTIHAVDNTISQARTLALANNVRLTTGGIIGDGPQSWSDVDIFAVSLTAGQVIKFDLDSANVDAGGSYGNFNGLLRLFSSGGTQVASNDNGTDPDTGISGNDPYLTYTVTASGTYYLGVSDSSNSTYNPNTSGGGYGMMSGAYVLQVLRSVTNQPPVATADSASTQHGTMVNIPVLSNDSDPNGDVLSLTQVNGSSHGTTQIVTVGGTSQIRYTPAAGYVGLDSFTYTISDASGETATTSVSVSVTNNNPVGVAESYTAVAGVTRTVSAGGVLLNDTDADTDSLTATLVSGVSHGTLSLNANGSFTYLATTGYSGTDSFVYRANDGAGYSANTTVTITVYASHVIAAGDAYSVGHDKSLTVAVPGLLANDWSYQNLPLTAVLVTSPTHGVLTLNGNGSFVYMPDSGYVGADSFTYRATNGTQQSSIVTVPLSVTNFAPWAVNDLYTVRHDRTLTRTATNGVLRNDVDIENDTLIVTLVSGTGQGTLSLNSNGSFSFDPNSGYTGTTSFTYRVSDGFNLSQIATATFQVINNSPNAGADWFYTPTGQPLAISVAELKSNDVDADNDVLALSVSASPLHGTLTVQPNGDFLYQPDTAWSGTDSFTYTISDGLASSAPTTVSIKVSNSAPIGVSDFYNLRHDRPLVVTTNSLVANDIDDDNDVLSVTLHTAPATGTLVLNSDGTFVYTPDAGATGDVTFKYRVTDGIVTSAPVTATIRITNAIPVGRTDSFQIHQGDTLNVSAANGVLQDDTDADNDQLTVSLFSGTAHGTLTLNANGSFSYTPNAGFSGSDSFSYRVTDGLATSAPVVVSINVSNAEPVANSNFYTVVHDRVRSVSVGSGVLANDFDLDGDTLTAVLVTGPSHGTLQLQANGSFAYTPASNYIGVDTFTYKAFDGSADSAPETVTLNVTNNRPWIVKRSFAVAHDQSISIAAPGLLAFSGDRESDVLSIVAGASPNHGSLVLNADGSFLYTPDAGFVGTDSFGYKASDGLQDSAEATVTIRVFNRLPVARTDYYSFSHDRPLTVSVAQGLLKNDSDLDNDNLTATLVAGQGPEHGTLSLQPNGSFTYTPAGGFVGADSFRYRVFDGAQSVEGTVNLSVQNSRPVGENDKYGGVVGQTLNVSAATGVLFNDVDADQDVLQAVLVSGTTHGTLSLSSNGSFSYTPEAGFIGVDTFRYQAKDTVNSLSFVKTVSISTALAAGHDELEVSHDRVLSADVADNDHSIPGTTPVYSLVAGPASGTLSLGTNGTFTYTPVADFVGEATFTYRFAVNGHYSNTATATISVVNEAPLVFTGTWRASHGKTITATSANGLAFRSRDRDGDDLSFAIVTQPTHGTLTLNAATGAFTYVPASSSYTGPDSFQWRARDGITWSAIETGYIELLNRKASLSPDSYQIHSGQTLTISAAKGLLANDYDSDGDSLQSSITVQPGQGTVTLNANGSFVYVPNSGVINANDSFKYKVYDGAEWSAETTVTVKVSNALPSTRAEGYSIRHDNILSVLVSRGVLANDYDNDSDALSATIATQPSHGTLSLSANGGFTYQPDAGYAGTDSFTYRAFDGFQQSGLVTVSLTVTNKAPVAGADQFITRRNSPMTFTLTDLKGNDSDADGDTLTLLPFSSPAHGSLSSSNGVWTYTPDAGFVGIDEFTYRVTDGVANSNLATVSIEVLNSAPVAAGDRFEVPHDQAFSVGAEILKTNDFDIENDALTTSLVTNVRNGTLSLQSNGAFTYTPNAGFIGRDSFSYRLSDGNLNSKPVRVILDVVNSRPTTSDAWYRLTHDTVFSAAASSGLLSRAKDSDGDNLTASIVADVRNGTLSVTAAGGWTYTPNAGFVGTDSFSYRVSDGSLQSTAKTVRLEVGNTPVVASMDAYTTTPNTALSVAAPGVLQNDSDVDDDTLILTVVDNVLHGTLTLHQNGSFVYVPSAGYVGQDTFTYKVSDGIEDTTATVTLTVTGIPQSGLTVPVSRSDFYSTSHSTPLTVSRSAGVLSNDRDPNNDSLTVQLVAGPSHGTLTLNANGSFSYQPFAGNATSGPFVGTDSFTYRVTDGSHLSAVTTAQIKVTNSLPWAANAAFETHQGKSIPVAVGQLSRDVGDNDQDSLIFSMVTNPANGNVTLNSNGTFSYTPDAGYSGTDTFIYRVRDAVGNSNNATVSIDVVNERPTAFDLEFSTTHGEVFNGSGRGVLAGASDQDNDTLTAHLVSNASHGTVVLNSDGTFTYTPVAGYAGDDHFFFKVRDGAAFSYNALVQLTVDNQKPVANDTFQSTQHDHPVVISLIAFDSDGDDLTYELVAAPQHGTLTYENLINNGSNGAPIRFTGRVTYHPANGYSGEDTFRYRVNDGVTFSDNAEVTLSVRNLAPRAADSMKRTIPGQPVVVTGAGLLATASDPDGDQLTLQIVTQPAHGTLTLVQSGGVYTGGYTYTPNAGYAGNDSFRWRVSDGADVSDTVTVSMTVQNNAPTIADHVVRQRYREATVSWNGQRTYTMDLAASGIAVDADKDALQYQIVANGQHGTATLTSAGLLKWTSASNTWTGSDKVIVRVTDGFSYSENAEIIINIDNTRPTAAGDFYSVHHNQTLTLTPEQLRGNDFDFDGDTLQIVSVTNGANGTLTQSGNNWVFNPGTFIGTTELTYIVSDGLVNSEPATIEIEVTNAPVWGIDRSFTVNAGTSVGFSIKAGDGLVNPDGDSIVVNVTSPVAHGELDQVNGQWRYVPEHTDTGLPYEDTAYIGTDEFTFTLSDGTYTSSPITYRFNIVNPAGGNEPGIASYDTDPENSSHYLEAVNGATDTLSPLSYLKDQYLSRSLRPLQSTDNLFGFTGSGTLEIETASGWISLNSGTTVVDVPSGKFVVGFGSSPSLTYQATSSTSVDKVLRMRLHEFGQTAEWSLDVSVKNTAPSAGGGVYYASRGTTLSGSLSDFVFDSDGDVMIYGTGTGGTASGNGAEGTLTISPNGTFTFQAPPPLPSTPQNPAQGETFATSFTFNVTDQFGATSTATATFASPQGRNIPEPPAPPVYPATATPPTAVADVFRLLSVQMPVGNVLSNDVRPPKAPWVASLEGSAFGAFGSIRIEGNGTTWYTPYPWHEGAFLKAGMEPDTFHYRITDGDGEYDIGTVNIIATIMQRGVVYSGLVTQTWGLNTGVVLDGTFDTWFNSDTSGDAEAASVAHVNASDAGSGTVSPASTIYWTGSVGGHLWLAAYGYLKSPIRTAGNLTLYSDVIEQPIFAPRVDAIAAWFSFHSVKASEYVGYAYADLAMGPVVSGGFIGSVSRGLYADMRGYTGGPIEWRTPIKAETWIGSVEICGTSYSDITAGGNISTVVIGGNSFSDVTAGGNIGIDPFPSQYGSVVLVHPFREYPTAMAVYASGTMVANIHAGGKIGFVQSDSDFSGSVTAGDRIWMVRSEYGAVRGLIGAGTTVDLVDGQTAVNAVVLAAENIGLVWSAGSIAGLIAAGINIGSVSAWQDVSAAIIAASGTIMSVAAGHPVVGPDNKGGDVKSELIQAKKAIGLVVARKMAGATTATSGGKIKVQSGIRAVSGYVGNVIADSSIESAVQAATDVSTVQASLFINGDVIAQNGSVVTVTATTGEISGQIKAKLNIGNVTAGTDRFGATTAETGSIQSVVATQGRIQGDIKAQNTLGTISAGTDISGNITATVGSIGEILAGVYSAGNISGGSIVAGANILQVYAKDEAAHADEGVTDVSFVDAPPLLQWINGEVVVTKPAKPPAPRHGNKGNITNIISAGGEIGGIVADGYISNERIEAGTSIQYVDAARDLLSNVTSHKGMLHLSAGGRLVGNQSAVGTVIAKAYCDISGSATSSNRGVRLDSLGDISVIASGELNVLQHAMGKVTGTATSALGILGGYAIDGVTLTSSFAAKGIGMLSLGGTNIDVTLESGLSDFFSVGDLTLNLNYSVLLSPGSVELNKHTIKCFGNVNVTTTWAASVDIVSWRNVEAHIGAVDDIHVEALGNAHFSFAGTEKGNIFVTAASVSGTLHSGQEVSGIGLDAKDLGNIVVRAFGTEGSAAQGSISAGLTSRSGGTVDLTARAAKRLSVGAWGTVSGILRSGWTSTVVSFADVSARIISGPDQSFARDGVTKVMAGGNITGNINARSSADITAIGDITGNIVVRPEFENINPDLVAVYVTRQDLSVRAMGNISGALTSFGDVTVFAGGMINGEAIRAADDVFIESAGVLSAEVRAGVDRVEINQGAPIPVSLINVIQNKPELQINTATLIGHSGITSDVFGPHRVEVVSFGTVSGSLTSSAGPVLLAAHVNVPLGSIGSSFETSQNLATPGNVEGDIKAGTYIEIRASGNVTSKSIEAGESISVSAHGSILGVEHLFARGGLLNVSSDQNISVLDSWSELGTDVEAVESIDGIFASASDIILWAGGNLSAGIAAGNGFVELTAIGNVTGRSDLAITGHTGVSVTAYGNINNIDVHSGDGVVDVSALGNISQSKISAAKDVEVLAIGSIMGNGAVSPSSTPDFVSRGAFSSVVSLSSISSIKVDGHEGSTVYAAMSITQSSVESSEGNVDVISSGTSLMSLVDASVNLSATAKRNLSVAALGGNISGAFTTTTGNIDLTARGSVSGTIVSGADAYVTATESLGGTASDIVQSKGNIEILVYGAANASIMASGVADLTVGSALSGSVIGKKGISVMILDGALSAALISESGSVNVFANGAVSSNVESLLHSDIVAVGSVTGNIVSTAESVSVASFGLISGDVVAGRNVSLFALDGVSNSTHATIDVEVASFGAVSGSIESGRDTSLFTSRVFSGTIIAGRNIDGFVELSSGTLTAAASVALTSLSSTSGTVTANGGDVLLWAGGSVSAPTSASRDVVVTAWGMHSTTVNAGGSAFLFTGEGGRSTVTAAEDLVYVTWGDVATVFAFAGQDAAIIGTGTLAGPVHAGRDVFVAGLDDVVNQVVAGRDAVAFSRGTFHGVMLDAGRDAVVIAGGNYDAAMTAGRDGFVYAFGSAIGTVNAEEFGGAVIWGVAAGPFIISGNDGAFLANIGGFTGSVTSTNGSAGVIEMGTFIGSISGGIDAWIAGEGSLWGSISGGQDAGASLYGNVTGSINAGRDAMAFTYAALNGSVFAGRDILWVYARGDIDGTIHANRNVGGEYYDSSYLTADVLSHGSIDATISASGTSTFGSGGRIGSVAAWGRIDGSISAAQSVSSVRSADLVGAIVSAPTVGSIVSNDETVLSQYPIPTIPDSVVPELMAWRTTILETWQQQAYDIRQDVDSKKYAVAQAIAAIREELSQARFKLEEEATRLADDLRKAGVDGKTALTTSIDASRREAIKADQQIRSGFQTQRETEIDRKLRMIEGGNKAFEASIAEAQRMAEALRKSIEELLAGFEEIRVEFHNEALIDQDWVQRIINDTGASLKNMIPLYQRYKDMNGILEDLRNADEEVGVATMPEWYFKLGNSVPIFSDIIINSYRVVDGRDPWTLHKLTTAERLMAAVGVVTDVLSAIGLVGGVVNYFTAPCRSFNFFNSCFVGETKVLVARLPQESTVAIAGAAGDDPDEMSIGAACLLIGLGCAVTAYAVGCRIPAEPRRRRRKLGQGMIDDLFSTNDPLSVLDEHVQFDTSTQLTTSIQQAPEEEFGGPTEPWNGTHNGETVLGDEINEQEIAESSNTLSPVEKECVFKNLTPTALKSGFASRSLAIIATLLLTIGGVLTIRDYAKTEPQSLVASVDAPDRISSQQPQYLSKDIRDLQVMQDRVLADNPLEDETELPLGEIVPAEWRVVVLEHTDPNGTRHIIERGMPLDEIEADFNVAIASQQDGAIEAELDPSATTELNDPRASLSGASVDLTGASSAVVAGPSVMAGFQTEPLTVGSTIFVDLPEHGISADFTVREIRPCPTPNPGDGYLVTTKFIHENAEILDLRIEGSNEPIGTTSSHPFWSEDRQQFIAAGELRVGENLLLADETTRRVESITLRPNRETVYNIEVNGEHVFYVGEDGVLVHNECAGLHHLVARYLGSKVPYGHKWLTRLSAAEHTHLHSAMRKWMRKNYPDLMHGPRRGREHMVNTYTLKSRVNAMREFYRQYRNPRSNKDFLKLFETELIKSAAKGWIE